VQALHCQAWLLLRSWQHLWGGHSLPSWALLPGQAGWQHAVPLWGVWRHSGPGHCSLLWQDCLLRCCSEEQCRDQQPSRRQERRAELLSLPCRQRLCCGLCALLWPCPVRSRQVQQAWRHCLRQVHSRQWQVLPSWGVLLCRGALPPGLHLLWQCGQQPGQAWAVCAEWRRSAALPSRVLLHWLHCAAQAVPSWHLQHCLCRGLRPVQVRAWPALRCRQHLCLLLLPQVQCWSVLLWGLSACRELPTWLPLPCH
jgi:hypothetical protein